MNTPRFAKAVTNLDDDLVESAANCRKMSNHRAKWPCIAASLAVLVALGALVLPSLWNKAPTAEDADGRYKNVVFQSSELAIVWPWEYQTVYEKYTETQVDGIRYASRGRAVSEHLVGDLIGTYTVAGFDNITDERHTAEFEVYRLKHADKSQYVTVRMDGTCYVFKKDTYELPRSLGELFALVDMPQAIELSRFSVNGDSQEQFALKNDAYIWQVLAGCENAPFIEDEVWIARDREYYSFTITSETLGVYKVAMYITEDGFLWTNAFNYQYLFDIGTDAAGKILQYAKENSVVAEYEPYQKSVVGEVTEITKDYILLDDSVLCADPKDGVTYKILLNDLRISRYAEIGAIRVGQTVQITYEGKMDEANGNVIDRAVSASEVIISDGDLLVPE